MASKIKTQNIDNYPYVLPSNKDELRIFIEKYKVDMMEQVVSSIELAVRYKLPIIEIFQFKDSNFVVTMSPKEFDINLEHIYKFYLQTEKYELCKRIVTLRQKLGKNNLNEKKKKSNTGFIE